MAMLLMSSMMMTVLPTPAPPKSPIFPPWRYGSSRSMTLMPVSNIFSSVDCCSSVGGCRWMGQCSFAWTGRSGKSTGSPSTFRTRPSVSGPTGTMMGEPVSMAVMPRVIPSVGFIATVRTRFSPRCCSTSATTSTFSEPAMPSDTIRTAL